MGTVLIFGKCNEILFTVTIIFNNVIFITEDKEHVIAARNLGMNAIHFKGPGQKDGDIENLIDSIPIIERLISSSSNNKS